VIKEAKYDASGASGRITSLNKVVWPLGSQGCLLVKKKMNKLLNNNFCINYYYDVN
jgi:hypothetical protein